MSWHTTRLVEFNHCDPAGIVFYPRYFEMINSIIEEFFADQLDYGFAPMHFEHHRGIPTASIAVDFKRPSHLGERLNFNLSVHKIGTSSLHLHSHCHFRDETRFTANQVLVHMDLNSRKSSPWTQELRAKLSRHLDAQSNVALSAQ